MSVGYAGVLPIRPVKRDNKDKPQLIEPRYCGKIAVSGLGEYCAKAYLLRPKIINIIPPIPARRVSAKEAVSIPLRLTAARGLTARSGDQTGAGMGGIIFNLTNGENPSIADGHSRASTF